MSWKSQWCPWGEPGEPRESISDAWQFLGGAPGGHWQSLGAPGGAPGESLGDPGRVFGAALADFRGDSGEQASKKSPGSISLTVLDPKRMPNGRPKGPSLRTKSNKIILKFECASGRDFGSSWAPSKVKMLYYH